MRIKSEVGPLRKNHSVSVPRYLTPLGTHSILERIASDRYRSRTVKSRKSDKCIIAPYRLFKICPE